MQRRACIAGRVRPSGDLGWSRRRSAGTVTTHAPPAHRSAGWRWPENRSPPVSRLPRCAVSRETVRGARGRRGGRAAPEPAVRSRVCPAPEAGPGREAAHRELARRQPRQASGCGARPPIARRRQSARRARPGRIRAGRGAALTGGVGIQTGAAPPPVAWGLTTPPGRSRRWPVRAGEATGTRGGADDSGTGQGGASRRRWRPHCSDRIDPNVRGVAGECGGPSLPAPAGSAGIPVDRGPRSVVLLRSNPGFPVRAPLPRTGRRAAAAVPVRGFT